MGCPLKYLYVQSIQRPLGVHPSVCLSHSAALSGWLSLPPISALPRSLASCSLDPPLLAWRTIGGCVYKTRITRQQFIPFFFSLS